MPPHPFTNLFIKHVTDVEGFAIAFIISQGSNSIITTQLFLREDLHSHLPHLRNTLPATVLLSCLTQKPSRGVICQWDLLLLHLIDATYQLLMTHADAASQSPVPSLSVHAGDNNVNQKGRRRGHGSSGNVAIGGNGGNGGNNNRNNANGGSGNSGDNSGNGGIARGNNGNGGNGGNAIGGELT